MQVASKKYPYKKTLLQLVICFASKTVNRAVLSVLFMCSMHCFFSWNIKKLTLFNNFQFTKIILFDLYQRQGNKEKKFHFAKLIRRSQLLKTSWSLPESLLGIFIVSYFFLSLFLSLSLSLSFFLSLSLSLPPPLSRKKFPCGGFNFGNIDIYYIDCQ